MVFRVVNNFLADFDGTVSGLYWKGSRNLEIQQLCSLHNDIYSGRHRECCS